MRPDLDDLLAQTRRGFLTGAASGLGAIALGALLGDDVLRAAESARPGPRHPGPARAGIFIFLAGGPSQVDLFDPKPLLGDHQGEPLPESLTRGKRFAFISGEKAKVMPTRYRFAQHGQCGMNFSDLVPHLATCADDLAMVRSMRTDSFNHLPGHLLINTGARQFGRPSVGSWVLYGLGSESDDLPGYVVLSTGPVRGGGANWSNGFLPPSYQGIRFNNQGDPVLNLSTPDGITGTVQRASLEALGRLNRLAADHRRDPEIAARIAAYELAFRMQSSAPELLDVERGETKRTLEDYGVHREDVRGGAGGPPRENQGNTAATFARSCLLARRLVERGVRFVTVIHGDWDAHGNLHRNHTANCHVVDQPIAALIRDLKHRGLLDSTLVVITGEFGRTCLAQGDDGRDHHPYAFTTLLAGGGVRGGLTYGKSDDFGFDVDENPVHVHDLHATMLHLFGLDHLRLTYRYQGRDMRLTDVSGTIVEPLLVASPRPGPGPGPSQ